MDEIWLYHYDTDTKQQSMEWRHSGSPGPKIKSERKNSGGKYLASNFWDREGILNFIIFLRAKLKRGVFRLLLVPLMDILKKKAG